MKNKTITKKAEQLEGLSVKDDSIPVVNVFQDCNIINAIDCNNSAISCNNGNGNFNSNGYGGSYLTDLHVSILVEQLKKKDEIINQLLKLVKELANKS